MSSCRVHVFSALLSIFFFFKVESSTSFGVFVSSIAVAGAMSAADFAASIIFTKPGLPVTIDAIKESRKIFQRMMNYSIYCICETIRVLFFITASIVVFYFYPVMPLMVVLLAILNDMPI